MGFRYLDELANLLKNNKIDYKHPYYKLYIYVRKKLLKLKIQFFVRKRIAEILTQKKKYIQSKKPSFEFPYDDKYSILERTVSSIEENNRLESFVYEQMISSQEQSNGYIAELEEIILKKIFTSLDEMQRKYDDMSTIEQSYSIIELKNIIEEECIKTLNTIVINNHKIVTEGKIEKKHFLELFEFVVENNKEIHMANHLYQQQLEQAIELQNKKQIIENFEPLFYQNIVPIIEDEIKKIDQKIIKILLGNKTLRNKFIVNNNYDELKRQIIMNEYIPNYIDASLDLEIYKLINVRCRLYNEVMTIKKEQQKDDLLPQTPESLKLKLREKFDELEIVSKSEYDVGQMLKRLKQLIFKQIVESNNESYIKYIKTIIDLNNYSKLCPFYVNSVGSMTILDAIYIYCVLINIDIADNDLEKYNQLIEFINDNKITLISGKMENEINQIIQDQFDSYCLQKKKLVRRK